MIFLLLDHAALGHLALTSTQVCSLVQSFLYTHTGLRKVLPPSPSSFKDEVDPQNFAKLGKCLLLRSSLDMPMRLRDRPGKLDLFHISARIL